MKIKEDNMIIKVLYGVEENLMDFRRIHSINLKMMYTKTRVESIMKPIVQDRLEEKKEKISQNK
jgi:hypothetical protein